MKIPIRLNPKRRLRQPLDRVSVVARDQPYRAPSFNDRAKIVEQSQAAATSSRAFIEAVQKADGLRDVGNWHAAEASYAAALAMYPYQNGYWVQHAHMLKEQERFLEAEISYRTACAFGAPASDVVEHFRFVVGRLNIEEWRFPLRFYKSNDAARQVPGLPDIQAFARLVWHVGGVGAEDAALLLRRSGTCDELLATMIADARFERANRDWLSVVREGEL